MKYKVGDIVIGVLDPCNYTSQKQVFIKNKIGRIVYMSPNRGTTKIEFLEKVDFRHSPANGANIYFLNKEEFKLLTSLKLKKLLED